MIVRSARRIRGRLKMPGDKSISHRAAMIGAMANGRSRIRNFSTSEDCTTTLRCLEQLGITIERKGADVLVEGAGRTGFRTPSAPLDCGNSGTTMRLLTGILAGQDFESTLTGDVSLRSRPMQRIIEPLQKMGASVSSREGSAPLTIRGRNPLQPVDYGLLLASAQVKSCILLAGLNGHGRTRVVEEQPTRDHTERLLRWFGVPIECGEGEHEGESFTSVVGPVDPGAREVEVPGDISSAAFFVAAAALIGGSSLEIEEVGLNPTRTLFVEQMRRFGLSVEVRDEHEESAEPRGTIRIEGKSQSPRPVNPQGQLTLKSALIPQLIDELPLLALIGSQVDGGIEIREAAELRVKESDRITATVAGLRAMGAEVEEFEDGLRVNGPTRLQGGQIHSHGDHRIAMTFAIAGLLAEGETEIQNAECVRVSFPEFFQLLGSVVEV